MIDSAIYERCVACGLCLTSCPTYLETMTETSGPRGRISLIKAVDLDQLDPRSPGFVATLEECLGCRACEAVCPSGVAYGALLEGARARIESARAPERSPLARRLRRVLLHDLFAHPRLLRTFAALLRFSQRLKLDQIAVRTGLARMLRLERAITFAPTFSPIFMRARDQRFPVDAPMQRVALHLGCIMSVAFTHVHEASIALLRRVRCEVVIPRGQACCGAIAAHAGEPEIARELAKRVITAFEDSGADMYALDAAGCGAALKEYGTWFSGDPAWSERARRFSAAVRDITEVLDERLQAHAIGFAPIDATLAYQDACHLAQAQRIVDAPRRLLARIPGVRLVALNDGKLCCGAAGVYNLTQPIMADRLLKRKIEAITASDAQVIVTANPGCSLQLVAGLRQAGRAAAVKHLVEILEEAARGYDAGTRSRSTSASPTVR